MMENKFYAYTQFVNLVASDALQAYTHNQDVEKVIMSGSKEYNLEPIDVRMRLDRLIAIVNQ